MFPEVELDEVLDVLVEKEKNYNLIVYNDDVHTFDYVIDLLIKVCKCEPIQAEQCTYLIHYKGKCQVKKGSFEELKPMQEILSDKGLTVAIE